MAMSKQFVIETTTGSLYKVEDVFHLLGSDRWILHRKDKRYAIVWIGQFYDRKGAIAAVVEAMEKSNMHIRVLEGTIGELLRKRACINASVFYVDENQFDAIIKWISHIHDPEQWSKIARYISYTSGIVHIYEG